MSENDKSDKAPGGNTVNASSAKAAKSTKRSLTERTPSSVSSDKRAGLNALAQASAVKAAASSAAPRESVRKNDEPMAPRTDNVREADASNQYDSGIPLDYGDDEEEEGLASPTGCPEEKRARSSSVASHTTDEWETTTSTMKEEDDGSRQAMPESNNEETRHGLNAMEGEAPFGSLTRITTAWRTSSRAHRRGNCSTVGPAQEDTTTCGAKPPRRKPCAAHISSCVATVYCLAHLKSP